MLPAIRRQDTKRSPGPDGVYTEDSLFAAVDARLERLAEDARRFAREGEGDLGVSRPDMGRMSRRNGSTHTVTGPSGSDLHPAVRTDERHDSPGRFLPHGLFLIHHHGRSRCLERLDMDMVPGPDHHGND